MVKDLETHSIVIPSGVNSMAKEVEVFGTYGAMHYQSLLFRIMDHLCGGKYGGGIWDMHECHSGAVIWVLAKPDIIDVNTFNGYDVRCTMFSVSIAANIIAMSSLASEMVDKGVDNAVVDKLIRNFELTKDLASLMTERQAIYRIID